MPIYALAFVGPSGGKVYTTLRREVVDGVGQLTHGATTDPREARKFTTPGDAILAAEEILGIALDWDLVTLGYRHDGLEIRVEQVSGEKEFAPTGVHGGQEWAHNGKSVS